MTPDITISDNLPNPLKDQVAQLVDYLLSEFPLLNHQRFILNLDRTTRKISTGGCFNNRNTDAVSSRISITAGTEDSSYAILFVIAHEYRHAVQNDIGINNSGNRTTTRRRGGADHETDADVFSVREVSRFLSIPPGEFIATLGWRNFYKLSVPVIKEEFNL